MSEIFSVPFLPSMCLACHVRGKQFTKEEEEEDVACAARPSFVTARSDLLQFKMKPGIFDFPFTLVHSTFNVALL
jgi:hypothetical protein